MSTKQCSKCQSDNIVSIQGHCSDSFNLEYKDKEYEGYVPLNIGIGGNDDIEMDYCLNCGQIQGTFPIEEKVLIEEISENEEDEE